MDKIVNSDRKNLSDGCYVYALKNCLVYSSFLEKGVQLSKTVFPTGPQGGQSTLGHGEVRVS